MVNTRKRRDVVEIHVRVPRENYLAVLEMAKAKGQSLAAFINGLLWASIEGPK